MPQNNDVQAQWVQEIIGKLKPGDIKEYSDVFPVISTGLPLDRLTNGGLRAGYAHLMCCTVAGYGWRESWLSLLRDKGAVFAADVVEPHNKPTIYVDYINGSGSAYLKQVRAPNNAYVLATQACVLLSKALLHTAALVMVFDVDKDGPYVNISKNRYGDDRSRISFDDLIDSRPTIWDVIIAEAV